MPRLLERNMIVKDWRKVSVKIALVYPGGYRAGMTGLTVQLLYHLFNLRSDSLCERVFIDGSKPPRSVESGRTLESFDIIAATIPYEEGYVELLKGLLDSGIPLHRCDRGDKHPIVLAGGIVPTSNPTVLEDFVDAFVIGDAEPIVDELIEAHLEQRSKQGRLEVLSSMKGFYVPGYSEGYIDRVYALKLDDSLHPTAQVVPIVDEKDPLCPVFGLTLNIEATRGCWRLCRFCLASWVNTPVRHRDFKSMVGLIDEGLRRTGVGKVSLLGAGISDNEWLKDVCAYLVSKGVEFSTPSIRMDLVDEELMKLIVEGGQRTLTLAPESASEYVRRLIGKPMAEDRIIEVAENAFKSGFKRLKLYFMLGLPGEDSNCLKGIGRMAEACARLGFSEIHISINPLIPKPQTPFQWLPLASRRYLEEAFKIVKSSMPEAKIRIEMLNPAEAELQALFSLGDRSVGRVAEYMALHDRMSVREASRAVGVDFEKIVYTAKDCDSPLPWSMVRSTDLKALREQYNVFERELEHQLR
ncbi:MAG: radical SAM protein [Candidatus Bathyarchaeia archaeon]